MSVDTISLIFFGMGVLLMLAEIILPGGVSFFLGLGAVITGLLRIFGVVEGILPSLLIWTGSALVLFLMFAGVIQRMAGGKISRKNTDEDKEAMGREVIVNKRVYPEEDSGRIIFQGTTWKARSRSRVFEEGERAVLVGRENITWIIDSLENLNSQKG